MQTEITEILNKINQYPEDTLLDKMMEYCEENDVLPNELGEILGKSEQFKRILWIDAVENNQIQDPLLKNKLRETGFDVW